MSMLPASRSAETAPIPLATGWAPREDPVDRIVVPGKRRLRVADLPRQLPVIRVLAMRDFKTKYKQSLLGPLWLVFQPLALLLAFVVGFHAVAKVKTLSVPYPTFVLVGLSVWSFFQAAMTLGTSSIVANWSLVRRTGCPRVAFPIASVIASLPALAVPAAAALVAGVAGGYGSWRLLLWPAEIAWLLILTLALVAISSSVTVRFRDLVSALPFLLQVGVFLAPVAYALYGVSGTLRVLLTINPLTGVIEAWRWTLLGYSQVDSTAVLVSLGLTAVLVVVGWSRFSRAEVTMADDI